MYFFVSSSRKTTVRLVAVLCVAVFVFLDARSSLAQQSQPSNIVLRNLELLPDVSIESFDEREIVLSNGTRLGWDEILQANVAPQQQQQFETNIEKIGLPIYRLKRRVQNLDWSAAKKIAEPMYQAMLSQPEKAVDREIQFLVYLAMMKGSLASVSGSETSHRSNPSAAIWPFLKAALLQPALPKPFKEEFADSLLPNAEVENLLSEKILPVWFDRSQAESAFEFLSTAYVPNAAQSQQGPIVYLASLAIKVGKFQYAQQLIDLLDRRDRQTNAWRVVLAAELAVANGNFENAVAIMENQLTNEDLKDPSIRVASLYLSASPHFRKLDAIPSDQPANPVSPLARAKDLKATLSLLRIASTYADTFPELAAASLFEAAKIVGDYSERDQKELQNELISRFPNSYHGRLHSMSIQQ